MHITCTLLYDHRGITIGYLDPTWSRTEESARKHAALTSRLFGGSTDEQTERRVRVLLRVRQISLAVPLREASVWNDHGRMWMHEKATLEIEAEDALKE